RCRQRFGEKVVVLEEAQDAEIDDDAHTQKHLALTLRSQSFQAQSDAEIDHARGDEQSQEAALPKKAGDKVHQACAKLHALAGRAPPGVKEVGGAHAAKS